LFGSVAAGERSADGLRTTKKSALRPLSVAVRTRGWIGAAALATVVRHVTAARNDITETTRFIWASSRAASFSTGVGSRSTV
jgi:hypothetical protein